MAIPTLTRDRLRRLAEFHPEHGRVLSVFLNLDPSEFATAAARATAVTSLMTDATHRVEETNGLDHDERQALRADLDRVRQVLDGPDLATGGTRGVAVFACSPADLLEVVRLPKPIPSRAVVDETPCLQPLVKLETPARWCVLLTTRRDARILMGTSEGFDEVERFSGTASDAVEDYASQHTTDREAAQHFKAVGEHLSRLLKAEPFDCLLIGVPDELANQVKQALHPYVRERLCGRLHVDVESVNAEQVRAAAAPLIEERLRQRERETLDRFVQEVSRGGRAVAGLEKTLMALNEHRVETLLLEEGFRAGGAIERRTGMLTVDGRNVPVDDPEFEGRHDIVEPAIERALEQSGDVLVVRRFPDLGTHGGIGAILRF
jgi:peptide chain release factor subunit 1